MEFFDKELKAARLLDDFVSSIHKGLGVTKEVGSSLRRTVIYSGRHQEAPLNKHA